MCCATRYAAQSLPFSRCWAQYTTEIYRCQVICKVRAGKVSIETMMQACLQKSSKCERAHDEVTLVTEWAGAKHCLHESPRHVNATTTEWPSVTRCGGARESAWLARMSPKCERTHDRAALQRGAWWARKRVTCTKKAYMYDFKTIAVSSFCNTLFLVSRNSEDSSSPFLWGNYKWK